MRTVPRMSTMARLKKPMTLALDPELLERLDAWIARQEFPPTKTAVFEAALRMWLDAKESAPARRKP